ncbi:unnamed protein product [Linum tenue]|uniref:RNase H type-1 domain-containing protein n=1 Tax=Linum tenue TaxID=586396 RepID=A0AAV0LCK7_9ROSI|nr:unnamed protein product [Linum tenue]
MAAIAQRKICEICGGVDDKDELIYTCIKCGVTTEHIYCMRTRTEDPDWVCEECNAKAPESTEGVFQEPTTLSFHNKVMPGGPSRRHYPFKRQVRPGKVKHISEEEVIKLMSGAEYVRTTKANITQRPSSMAQKFPVIPFKANPRIPSGSAKNAAYGGRNFCSTFTPSVPRRSEEKRAKGFDSSAEKVKKTLWTSSKKQVEEQKRFHKDSNHSASLETMNMDVLEMKTLVQRLRSYEPYLPAKHATWKGSFKILDNQKETQVHLSTRVHKAHGPSLELPAQLQQFQAQPATRVCLDAYELSLKMPAELQVKLLPRSEFWTPLFGNDPPDLRDIAFYIFPAAEAERSVENHTKLLECMEAQDLVMRTDVEGVELLIFLSKQLDTNMQDIIAWWDMKQFLWGVFSPADAEVQVSPPRVHVSVPEYSDQPDCGISNIDNDDDADSMMEIDMEGGKEVGRPDIVIRRKDLYPRTIPQFNGEVAVADMNASKLSIHTTTSPCINMQTGSKKCKIESLEGTLVEKSAHYQMGQHLSNVKVECDDQEEGVNSSILWTPPPADWVKLNVAVATSFSGGATTAVAAGIIRDSAANWQIGYTLKLGTTTTHCSNSLKAELKALLEGLKLAWGRGFTKVVVEFESKRALECLTNKQTTAASSTTTSPHDLTEAELTSMCKERIMRKWDCKLQLVSVEGNSSAQMLAHTSFLGKTSELNVMENPPRDLHLFLEIDGMKL